MSSSRWLYLTWAVVLVALAPGAAWAKPAKAPDPDSPAGLHRQATRALKAGKLPLAAHKLERYLEAAGDKVGGFAAWKRKQKAKKDLDRLRKKLGTLTLKCDVKGAKVMIRRKALGETPLPPKLYLKPGRHRLELSKEGHVSLTKRIKVKRGQHLELELALPLVAKVAPTPAKVAPKPAPAKPAPKAVASQTNRSRAKKSVERPLYKRWWFWTAIGVAVVVTGVTAGVVATQPGEEPELGVIRFQ